MQIGSIVAVKKLSDIRKEFINSIIWLPIQDEKTPYVIRDIALCEESNDEVYLFEEGVICYNGFGEEVGIRKDFLIELLPPQVVSIEEIIKDVEPFKGIHIPAGVMVINGRKIYYPEYNGAPQGVASYYCTIASIHNWPLDFLNEINNLIP